MNISEYLDIKRRLVEAGYEHEIAWAETVGECKDADHFFCEYAWVVLNSGMKSQVAEKIWQRVRAALSEGRRVREAFGHPGKAAAIQQVYDGRAGYFYRYLEAKDKLEYIVSLPWIGDITKFHLAKNLGMDVCKPDRHLVRISQAYSVTPEQLCQGIADEVGDRIGTVDLVLWRAANLGWI